MSRHFPTCERCLQPIGAPHQRLDGDCLLGHDGHEDAWLGYLCRRHFHWIDNTLRQIEELFALLPSVIIPGPSSSGGRSATRIGSPAPGSVEIMALTDPRGERDWIDDPDAIPDVPGALGTWVRLMDEEMTELNPQHQPHACAPLTRAVGALRHERQWIARQPWVDDYAGELEQLHRAVARGLGDSMWPRPIGACPNCATRLYNTIGVDEVTCRKCRTTWAGVALARLRLIHEQEGARR